MNKAILYLLLVVLFFTNSAMYASTLCQSVGVKATVHKTQNKKAVRNGLTKKGSASHKAELLNDYDDELDEYEVDDYNSSVKGKLVFVTSAGLNNNVLPANFVCKSFCDKIYNHVNFSRLPRFNYISLRVLRL